MLTSCGIEELINSCSIEELINEVESEGLVETVERISEALYRKGMAYGWKAGESPADTALSKSALEKASRLGHLQARSALADKIFSEADVDMDRKYAIYLKWLGALGGLLRDDFDSLVDMLEELSSTSSGEDREGLLNVSSSIKDFIDNFIGINWFMHRLGEEKYAVMERDKHKKIIFITVQKVAASSIGRDLHSPIDGTTMTRLEYVEFISTLDLFRLGIDVASSDLCDCFREALNKYVS